MKYCSSCMSKMDDASAFCEKCGKPAEYACPAHHLLPGTLLNGKFLVGAAIGEGGFGITYIGRDVNLDIKVAIKEYYPNGYANRNNTLSMGVTEPYTSDRRAFFEKGKNSFLNEARALARFPDEPGIVSVRDFFEENNTAYIVMEYLEGKTLKALLKESGTMPAGQVVRMLLPVMRSLQNVHREGVIHRDISPDNIMVAGSRVKLLDFGAARTVSAEANQSLSVVLKPGFAPEEQYRSRGKQGPWTDIYALCATIYKCVTGVTPEDSNDRVMSDELKKPSELQIPIDPKLEAVLMKGLAVFAENRYQDMASLLADLAAATGVASPAPLSEDDYPTEAIDTQRTAYAGTQKGKKNPPPAPDMTPPVPEGKPDAAEREAKPARKKQTGLIVGCVVGVLVLAGIAASLPFILKNRDGDPAETTSAQEAVSEDTETEDGGADAPEAEILAQGDCGDQGDNVSWTLDENGVLTVSGEGKTADYKANDDVPWFGFVDRIRSVRVLENVTVVGKRVFAGCSAMETVSLSGSLTEIGEFAFQRCTSLSEVVVPASVETVNPYAFDTCRGLSAITVASANPNYKDSDGVLYTKDGKTLCRVPAAVTGEFTVPEGVETIGSDAFCGAGLSSVVLPKSLKTISKYAFDECDGIRKMTVSAGNDSFSADGNAVFSKDKKILVAFPAAYSGTAYEIPDFVETVADTAFCNTNLTEIVFPASVRRLGAAVISQAQSDITLTFRGDAPVMDALPVNARNAVQVRYPENASGWDALIASDQRKQIEWRAVD